MAVQPDGPNANSVVPVLWNATVTTGLPPVPTVCVNVKSPASV